MADGSPLKLSRLRFLSNFFFLQRHGHATWFVVRPLEQRAKRPYGMYQQLCSAQPSPAGNAWIPRTSKFHGLGRPLEFTWKFVDREPNTFVLAHPTQSHGWTGPNTSGSIKINVDRWSARTNPVVCTSSSAVLSSGSRRSPWPAPSAAPITATSSRTSCFIAGLLLDRLGVAPCVCPADSLGAGSCGRARPGSGCRRLRCRRQGSSRGRRRGRGCLRNLCSHAWVSSGDATYPLCRAPVTHTRGMGRAELVLFREMWITSEPLSKF
jgi:hypothetical protein